jgi:hypothetical protein
MEATIELGRELPASEATVVPPEASLMETYHNPCYGYSVRYPSQGWPVQKGDQGDPQARVAIAGLDFLAVGIAAAPEPQLSLDQVVAQWKAERGSQRQGQLQEERGVLNGHDAWIATRTSPEAGMLTKNILVVNNKMRYELAFAVPLPFYNELQSLVQAIADSLTLGEPQPSCTPAPFSSPPSTLWEAPAQGWCQFAVPARANLISVSQSKLVWSGPSEPGSYLADRVFLYDLATGQVKEAAKPTREGGQVIPARISGDWIVWVDYQDIERGSDWIFFALNLKTGEKQVVAENEGVEQYAPIPSIQGNRVVWKQPRKEVGSRDAIQLYDLASGQTITLLAPPSCWLGWPTVYGDMIVYLKSEEVRDSSASGGLKLQPDVYIYDLGTRTERRVSSSGKASQPAVWGDYVVWLEDYLEVESGVGLGSNVFLHCLSSQQTQQLTRGARADLPSVGDRFISWHTPEGPVTAYDLLAKRLMTMDRAIDREVVGGAYTSEGAIAWYWMESNVLDPKQKTEIRVVAPCIH